MQKYPDNHDEINAVREPDMTGTYTAEDYMSWTFEGLFELIRGKVFKMSPAPSMIHQKIAAQAFNLFNSAFSTHPCEVYFAPIDVYLVKEGQDFKKTRNIVQLDIAVICDKSKIRRKGCIGAPDLAVEILSPHTTNKDLKIKFGLYEEYGIREYWIIFPQDKVVNIYTLEQGRYGMPKIFTEEESAVSSIFPELIVPLKDIFKGVDEIKD